MKRLCTLITLVMCLTGIGKANDVFTVAFDGKATQSVDGFFTITDPSINYNKKYTGTYDGKTYAKGLKIQSGTSITFTTSAKSTVTIVQSLTSNNTNYIKLDNTAFTAEDRVDDATNNVGVYTVTDVEAGEHTIKRASSECGLLFIKVEYTGADMTQLAAPQISYDQSTGTVTIAKAAETDIVKYTTDGTNPSDANGIEYTEPFTAEDGMTVKAAAIGDGVSTITSEVSEKLVLLTGITLSAPEIKSMNGTVALTCSNPGVVIEYSTDGTSYASYTRSFTLMESCNVIARSTREGCQSGESSAWIDAPEANDKTKTIYMGYGSFNSPQDIDGLNTLVGKSGDAAEGYSLILNKSGKTWSELSGAKIYFNESETRTAIKLSNGAQNILTLPEGVKATRLTLYSVVNYASASSARTCGWSEINGEAISYADIPMGAFNDVADRLTNPDIRIFPLDNVTGQITFTNAGEQLGFIIALDVIETANVSVGEDGIATYCSDKALDFSNATAIEAYTATSFSGTTIHMTKVTGSVPAGTGLVLRSVSGGAANENINIVASADPQENNMLVGVVASEDINASKDGSYNYIFGKGNSGIGFYKLNSTVTLPANKAYLHTTTDLLASSGAKGMKMVFGDEATGIDEVTTATATAESGTFYNLKGMKVAKPQKGLYIKDGKKILIK